ncbi:MAG TPA: hypothetical protein VGD98_04165 [Ktedonobacteraceae bacterium]
MQNLSYHSTDSPGEIDCVKLARKGNGPAFAQLFQQYNAPVCTYLARLVGDDELGRDLAQGIIASQPGLCKMGACSGRALSRLVPLT